VQAIFIADVAANATLVHQATWELAERVGFEPTVSLHPRRFSRPLP
jgi:hypothetical protein